MHFITPAMGYGGLLLLFLSATFHDAGNKGRVSWLPGGNGRNRGKRNTLKLTIYSPIVKIYTGAFVSSSVLLMDLIK